MMLIRKLSLIIYLQKAQRNAAVVNAFLVLASLACMAALVTGLEVASRLHDPGFLIRTRDVCVFSRVYGWDTRKGISALVEGKPVTLNRYGYRGRELPRAKSTSRTRLLIIGDSIAFGFNAGDDETFGHLLDARDNGVEVVNLAVQGFGPDQALLKLTNEGLAWQPDVVIMAHCVANDFADAVLPVFLYDGVMPKPRFRLERNALILEDGHLQQTRVERLQGWLADYSFLFNRFVLARRDLARRWKVPVLADTTEVAPHWGKRYDQALSDQDLALRLNAAIVRRMGAVCRERGVRFVVAVFPSRKAYSHRPALVEGFLETIAGSGIPAIDMAEAFRARQLTFKQVACDGIGHLTPLGHRATSEIIERSIAGVQALSDVSVRANRSSTL